jgi:hypothetical protein
MKEKSDRQPMKKSNENGFLLCFFKAGDAFRAVNRLHGVALVTR